VFIVLVFLLTYHKYDLDLWPSARDCALLTYNKYTLTFDPECEGLCLTYLKQIRPWPLTECEGLCLHRTQFSNSWYCYIVTTAAALLENNEASARLTTANGGTFTLTSPRLSSQSCYSMLDWRTLTWLATATGWARSKCSAICSGKLISVYMIWYDVNRRYGI